ncbi:MAG: hypothetical protein HQL54_02495 [Magnetococcales bacterium]|nr:hypothetical protein [Magnetococcales bacterium]
MAIHKKNMLDTTLTDHQNRLKNSVNRLTRIIQSHANENGYINTVPQEILIYLHTLNWLRVHGHPDHVVKMIPFGANSPHAYLMPLFSALPSDSDFIRRYLDHWFSQKNQDSRRERILWSLSACNADRDLLSNEINATWQRFNTLTNDKQQRIRLIQKRQKQEDQDTLGSLDQQRLALIDQLPDIHHKPITKIGLIPVMSCPESCPHCMFVWRTPMKQTPDPGPLFEAVNKHTRATLFTGGDLTPHLNHFYRAIRQMDQLGQFAILLNGSFAESDKATERVFQKLDRALNQRPANAVPAQITVQISFDEFHQQRIFNRHGEAYERIPVENIARIVNQAVHFSRIRLSLIHKQNPLNFSNDLFKKGVFGRLAEALGKKGHTVKVLQIVPSHRPKKHPITGVNAPVIREAVFVLEHQPNRPVHFMSSTLDAYGRAALVDESDYVNERDYLQTILNHGPPADDAFDTDPMVWFNGRITLFSAIHIALGDVLQEGFDAVINRWHKDPLRHALERFDPVLLKTYGTLYDDLDQIKARATGPHYLFHQITKTPEARLALTKALL